MKNGVATREKQPVQDKFHRLKKKCEKSVTLVERILQCFGSFSLGTYFFSTECFGGEFLVLPKKQKVLKNLWPCGNMVSKEHCKYSVTLV